MAEPGDIRSHFDELEAVWKEHFRERHGDEAADSLVRMMREVRQSVDLTLINELGVVSGEHVRVFRERYGDDAAHGDVGLLVREFQEKVTVDERGVPPHIFTGYASIDGQMAANGVRVEARIDGVPQGTATVMNGLYTLAVERGSSDRVYFFVDGCPTLVDAKWLAGGASMRDLDAQRGRERQL